MIPADASTAGGERWIVWDKGFGRDQAVHIALCDTAGKCRWEQSWPDAYAPTIQYMGGWSTADDFVFLLIYSEGAEAQTAVVIGLRKGMSPTVLDQVDAASISVSPRLGGLEIDVSAGLPSHWRCLRWDKTRQRLLPHKC